MKLYISFNSHLNSSQHFSALFDSRFVNLIIALSFNVNHQHSIVKSLKRFFALNFTLEQ